MPYLDDSWFRSRCISKELSGQERLNIFCQVCRTLKEQIYETCLLVVRQSQSSNKVAASEAIVLRIVKP
jgi:hypothetical protein